MKYSILTILAICSLSAADPTKDVLDNTIPATVAAPPVPQVIVYKDIKDLPPEAVRALDTFNREEARVRFEYEKKVETERKRLLTALEQAKMAATRNGKLEEALAVKKVAELLNPEVQAKIVKNKVNQIVGEWRQNNSLNMNFTADGISICSNGDRGKWEMADNKFIVSWKSGWKDTYTIVENSSDTIDGIGKTGVHLTLVRIKP